MFGLIRSEIFLHTCSAVLFGLRYLFRRVSVLFGLSPLRKKRIQDTLTACQAVQKSETEEQAIHGETHRARLAQSMRTADTEE